ncbi:DUF4135 domain-containing protein [Streptomyces sp. NPDC057620]|uniref:DUF4135 domain-containing protein n=1 Tax=Streptomyces sp. NPDC057620 TaxID=3346185 RepID=UPI0036B45E88
MTGPQVSIPAFLPFYSHVIPSGAVASALHVPAAPAVEAHSLGQVLDGVREGLVRSVEGQSFRMLIGEFHTFREELGLPMTTDGDQALRRFEEWLRDPRNCRRTLGRYPVLGHRLETLLRGSLDAYAEMFHAYTEDLPALRAAGLTGSGPDGKRLTAVSLAGSDLHNDGRQVIGVRLAEGTRLVYKPRPLVSDAFVRDLYAAAGPYLRHPLRHCVPRSITSGDHGWQQYVPRRSMDTPEQAARYFYRFGALCALFGSIGACDLHHENLLAHGEHPCVVDTETVVRPDPGPVEDTSTLPAVLLSHLQLSVATTMLVPMAGPGSPADVLMAGVGIPGEQPSRTRRPVVRNHTTDAVSVGWQPVTYRHDTNVPRLGDTAVPATEHYAEVLAGYADALGSVRGGAVTEVLDAYPQMPVRCLVRSTMVYGRYIDAATHPDYLVRSEEADRLFSLLDRFPVHLAPEAARHIGEAERASLAVANVPYFTTRGSATEMTTRRTRIPAVHRRSPLELARSAVALNAARGDRYHRFLLEETFGELTGDGPPEGLCAHSVFGGAALDGACPGTWWRAIAAGITDLGVSARGPGGPETGWLCGVGPGDGTPTLAPGTFLSFHDSGGIVAFLERASHHHSGLREAYRSADRGLSTLLASYGDVMAGAPESVFSGSASLLLTRPSRVDPARLAELLGRVEARAAAGDLGGDLVTGPAGPLMVLLSGAGAGGGTVDDGPAWPERLVGPALDSLRVPRTADWWDVAHGELGLRWARSRIGGVLGDAALTRESASWLTARPPVGEEHSVAGWCKGAAGLLLASAEILAAAGRADRLTGRRLAVLVDRATRLPAEGPVDLSVCHGSSGVVQSLIAAGRCLGDPSLVDRAHEYQALVLGAIRERGFFTGARGRTSLLGYMLGWAGVADTDLLLHSTGGASRFGAFMAPVSLSAGAPG